MSSREFVHVHESGRFDRSADSLRKQYKDLIARHKPSIITGTEHTKREHKKVLREFTDYGRYLSSVNYADDCTLMWEKAEWKVVHRETYQMSAKRHYNANGNWRLPLSAKIVVLENKVTGENMLVTVAHLPSSVQSGNGFKNTVLRVAVWNDAVRNWKKKRNKIYKKYKCTSMLVVADWNVDLKRRFFRSLLRTIQPGMKFAWKIRDLPEAGTHGRRLIDFTMYRGKIKMIGSPKILKKYPASDHVPYKEKFRLTRKKK